MVTSLDAAGAVPANVPRFNLNGRATGFSEQTQEPSTPSDQQAIPWTGELDGTGNCLQPDEKSAPQTSVANEYPSGLSLLCILMALILTIFLGSLDMTIVATAIPKITDEFKSLDQAAWYGTAFFMTNGGFQSSWGKAYKYFPLKGTFLIALFVFELGSLLCAVAPNSNVLILGRAINGLGGAGIGTGAYTIAAVIASPAKRPTYTGIIGMSYGVAAVAGPLIGGVFSDKVTWRWCFYINLPIGGLAAALIFFLFHTPQESNPTAATFTQKMLQLDLLGVVILIGAIVSCLLALEYGGQAKAWSDPTVVGLLIGFVAIVAVFCLWEKYQDDRAIIMPRIFRKQPVQVSAVFTFFFGGSYFLSIYYLPMYFQSVKGANPSMSGVMGLPLILSVTIAMLLSGLFISATGLAALAALCGSAIATVGAGLLYTLDLDSVPAKWIGYQTIAGIGFGLALQVPIIIGQASATVEDMSSTTSVILLFQCLGGAIYVGAAQTAFINTMAKEIAINSPGTDAAEVIATGATAIRSVFSSETLNGIIVSYMAGIKVALAISIAGCGVAVCASAFNNHRGVAVENVKDNI